MELEEDKEEKEEGGGGGEGGRGEEKMRETYTCRQTDRQIRDERLTCCHMSRYKLPKRSCLFKVGRKQSCPSQKRIQI